MLKHLILWNGTEGVSSSITRLYDQFLIEGSVDPITMSWSICPAPTGAASLPGFVLVDQTTPFMLGPVRKDQQR